MVTNLASLGHCDNVKAADAVARDALQPAPCRRRHDGVLRIVILDFAPLSIASFRASSEHLLHPNKRTTLTLINSSES
jgi:hypothetical protein